MAGFEYEVHLEGAEPDPAWAAFKFGDDAEAFAKRKSRASREVVWVMAWTYQGREMKRTRFQAGRELTGAAK